MERTDGAVRFQDVQTGKPDRTLLQLLLILIVVALVAGAMGFTGLAGAAATLAQVVAAIMLNGIVLILLLAFMGLDVLF